MNKKVRDTRLKKQERVAKDVAESYPAVVLCSNEFILMLACSSDYRRRMKKALDRILTVSFGSEGYRLQEIASALAKGRVLDVSYDNVDALFVAKEISEVLATRLRRPALEELNGAIVVVRIAPDRMGDEVVVVSYDGSISLVSEFFSGPTNSSECDEECLACKGDGPSVEDETASSNNEKKNKDNVMEVESLGAPVPKFQEFVLKKANKRRKGVSVWDLVLKFGNECAELFGDDIFVQFIQLSRDAVRNKDFSRVVSGEAMAPWPVLKEYARNEIKEIKNRQKQQTSGQSSE